MSWRRLAILSPMEEIRVTPSISWCHLFQASVSRARYGTEGGLPSAWQTPSRASWRSYGAQGGDWGSDIALALGRRHGANVAGIHVNLLYAAAGKTTDERVRSTAERYRRDLSGYNVVQSQRPASLMYAFTDSPVGQLAWIAERFHDWTDSATPVPVDRILTDVSVYWFTRTAGSAALIYRETCLHGTLPTCRDVPVGVAVFPNDIEYEARDRAEERFQIMRWTEFSRGGHFAALEVPDLLVRDVRAFFAPLR